MAFKLSYQTRREQEQPAPLEQYKTAQRMMLVVDLDSTWFPGAATFLLITAVGFALLSAPDVSVIGISRPPWRVLCIMCSVVCALGLLRAWDASRRRMSFEIARKGLYVSRFGPLHRSTQFWARSTVDDIRVNEKRDGTVDDGNVAPERWIACIQIISTYKKRKYNHEFLSGREVELLREMVNALRMELGWLPQDPTTEREKDKLEKVKGKLEKGAAVGDSR